MKKVNEVFQTKDYFLFEAMEGNRTLNQANLKKLIKSMESELLQVPIIVNENYQIIDGQHRFEACKQLDKEIYFMIVPGYKLDQVHKLNAISKKWTSDDYMQAYADLGLKDYQQAREFKDKYKFGHKETMSLLLGHSGVGGAGDLEVFFNGKFKVKSLREATDRAEMLLLIAPYYDGYRRRSFVGAMLKLFSNKEFRFKTFIKKLSYQSAKMVDCTTTTQYLMVIENIYNYKNKTKVRFI